MEITLEQLLSARDARAEQIAILRKRYGGACVVAFTVVAPGPDKQTPEARRLFDAGIKALQSFMLRYEIAALAFKAEEKPTGSEAYLVIRTDPVFLKTALCALEESAPYGRLWDMDVVKPDGRRVDRGDVGLEERGCIVCGKPGRACYSRRLHPMEEVLGAVKKLADTLKDNQIL